MHGSYAETQKKITQESIVTALLKLLENKSFNEVTITQITHLAGVSRMAFYRNYNTKEDIIAVYLDDLVDAFYSRFLDLSTTSKHDILCNFFSFFKERKHFIDILIHAGLIHIFQQKLNVSLLDFFNNIEGKNKPEYGFYFANFHAGGLYNVLLEWLTHDAEESVEAMANLIETFTCS